MTAGEYFVRRDEHSACVACGAAVEPELESVHAGWHEAIVKAFEDRDTILRRLLEKAQIIRKSQ